MKGLAFLFAAASLLTSAELGRDFSGHWELDSAQSNLGTLANAPDTSLAITQDPKRIYCSSATGEWSYELDGRDSVYRLGTERRNSAVKWEGSALLINTLVSSGSQQYSLADRWR